MVENLKRKRVWIWTAAAALVVVIVLFSTQAFSAAMSVTAQPLQNSGANGAVKFNAIWSAATTGGVLAAYR